jgi:D-sedoheptulose 7-phosphate isomerase
LVQAVSAAREKQLQIIALTGEADNDISAVMTPDDMEITIPTRSHARLIEAHMLITHAFCEIVEYTLFGIGDPL